MKHIEDCKGDGIGDCPCNEDAPQMYRSYTFWKSLPWLNQKFIDLPDDISTAAYWWCVEISQQLDLSDRYN